MGRRRYLSAKAKGLGHKELTATTEDSAVRNKNLRVGVLGLNKVGADRKSGHGPGHSTSYDTLSLTLSSPLGHWVRCGHWSLVS